MTRIEQVRDIIKKMTSYEGNNYTSVLDINHINESLPKFFIEPVQNYDNSNTEQVKYYNITFKCSSEIEMETVQDAILALTSDNLTTGYNKTSTSFQWNLDIEDYVDDFSFDSTGPPNYLIDYISSGNHTKMRPYRCVFQFNLDYSLTGSILSDTKLYVTPTLTVSTGSDRAVIAGIYTDLAIDDYYYSLETNDLNLTTKYVYNAYPNNDSDYDGYVKDVEQFYEVGSISYTPPYIRDYLHTVIQELIDSDDTLSKIKLLYDGMGLVYFYTRDENNSNSGKYARLVITGTAPTAYPFYIDVKQIPIDELQRDYNANEYKCRFQVEARWAI